jgi:hypothetical protein
VGCMYLVAIGETGNEGHCSWENVGRWRIGG